MKKVVCIQAEQTSLIPDNIDENIHGIHMETCYKKYKMIISKYKHKSTSNIEQPKIKTTRKSLECSSTLTSPFTGVKLFLKYCFFCEQTRKKFEGKEQLAQTYSQDIRRCDKRSCFTQS